MKKDIIIKLLFVVIISFGSLNLGFSKGNDIWKQAESEKSKQNYEKAIKLYTICIKSNVCKYLGYYKRADCYYRLGRYGKVKVNLRKALRVPIGDPWYDDVKSRSYWLFSTIVSRKENSKRGLKLMKKAALHGTTSLLYSTLAYKEIAHGFYDDAINNLNYSIRLDSRNAWAYSNRALAYLKLNELELAREDVNTSIQLDGNNPYAYMHSAMIYIAHKDFIAACLELKKAIEIKANCPFNMVTRDLDELNVLLDKYCVTQQQE
jgi:tetratricopeptide (TPR) repeat protein